MFETQDAKSRTVLISGASIAGPALAYWLDRYGFDVTVVERAPTVRSGGYPIDVRGSAIERRQTHGRAVTTPGRPYRHSQAAICRCRWKSDRHHRAGELGRRSERSSRRVAAWRTDFHFCTISPRDREVRYRFDDSIDALHDDGAGVDVRFRSGAQQRFDIVIGADGMHSNTRNALVFGPEAPFTRHLGFCFNVFSVPNDLGLSHEAVIYAGTVPR